MEKNLNATIPDLSLRLNGHNSVISGKAEAIMKGEKNMFQVCTIRIKIGDVEAEVTGPKSWVEKQIEKIIKIVKTHSQSR